jgi:hypothetical protein
LASDAGDGGFYMSQLINSGTTSEEEFRLTGTVSPSGIETLLDSEDKFAAVANVYNNIVYNNICEALRQFPDDDFLTDIIERVRELATCVRGKNREEAESIAADLGEIHKSVKKDFAAGRRELKESVTAIEATW